MKRLRQQAKMKPPSFETVTNPVVSCRTQPFEAEPLRWPSIETDFRHGDVSYQIRSIDLEEVDAVATLFQRYYPQLYRTIRHDLLEESFYRHEVAMRSRWSNDSIEKKYYVCVMLRVGEQTPLFAALYQKDVHDPVIQLCAAVLDPAVRGMGLARYYAYFTQELLDRSAADYAFATPHVKDPLIQEMALQLGFEVGGVMPGAFRWACAPGSYFRDALVYIYKYLNGAEAYSTSLQDWKLADEVRERIQHLPAMRVATTSEPQRK